jgi:methyl-accepting chemotaxis protein
VQFLRDLSVRGKLFGGFGAVLLLAVVVGAVLLSQMGSINAGGVYIGGNALPSTQMIGQINRDVADYRQAQLRYALESKALYQTAAKQQWTADDAQIQATLTKYASIAFTNAQDQQFWQSVKSQWSAYKQQTARIETLGTASAAALPVIHATDPTLKQLEQTVGTWQTSNIKWANESLQSNASTYSSARTLGIGLLVLLALVAIGLAFLVSRQIKQGVDAVLATLTSLQDKCANWVREGLEAFASGDLTNHYEPVTPPIGNPSKDEIGQVGQAVNGIRERTVASLKAYNEAAEKLRAMIGDVSKTADSVTLSSQQMASTSDEAGKATGEIAHAIGDIAQGAERQVQMVEQARQSAEEVARAVQESAENAKRTAEVAHEAREIAQQGVGAAEQANEAMGSVRDSTQAASEAIRELASKSGQIGAIVQTITGIAEQTNLLALNAAIEAARAGEQGRGFAVVAEEVRKLAEDSQSAAHEISGLIGAIQTDTSHAVQVVEDGAKRTEEGVSVVEQTREAFLKIGSSVEDMTARIEQIATASAQIAASAQSMQDYIGEVAAVAEQSSASTEEVSASTQQTSASTEQIAASAQELSGNAQTLDELVSQFKLTA